MKRIVVAILVCLGIVAAIYLPYRKKQQVVDKYDLTDIRIYSMDNEMVGAMRTGDVYGMVRLVQARAEKMPEGLLNDKAVIENRPWAERTYMDETYSLAASTLAESLRAQKGFVPYGPTKEETVVPCRLDYGVNPLTLLFTPGGEEAQAKAFGAPVSISPIKYGEYRKYERLLRMFGFLHNEDNRDDDKSYRFISWFKTSETRAFLKRTETTTITPVVKGYEMYSKAQIDPRSNLFAVHVIQGDYALRVHFDLTLSPTAGTGVQSSSGDLDLKAILSGETIYVHTPLVLAVRGEMEPKDRITGGGEYGCRLKLSSPAPLLEMKAKTYLLPENTTGAWYNFLASLLIQDMAGENTFFADSRKWIGRQAATNKTVREALAANRLLKGACLERKPDPQDEVLAEQLSKVGITGKRRFRQFLTTWVTRQNSVHTQEDILRLAQEVVATPLK